MTTLADKDRGVLFKEKRQNVLAQKTGQYALWRIIAIWLAGGAPMWILGWLVYPALRQGLPAADAGLLRIKLLTAGLIWQFVLSMLILYKEEGDIRIETRPAVHGTRIMATYPLGAITSLTSSTS